MKNIKEVYDTEDNPLSEKEIRLFKYLNNKKQEFNTQSKMLDLIKTMMPFIGRPESDARFYYEIYTTNYRPDGDYENLDKTTFKDYRSFKQRKTPNNSAYQYSSAKIPFKGSNLEGYWHVNDKNQWYYVVISYNWYPVFLFINNQWYQVSEKYSSSTAKHMSGSNPVRYNSGLDAKVILVSPQEIDKLRLGIDLETIKTKRVIDFVEKVSKELIGKSKLFSTYGYYQDNQPRKKIRYTITNIKEENGKVVINVTIDKAGDLVDGKMVLKPEGYDVPSPYSEDIEKNIKRDIIYSNQKYLGMNNTEFIFNHTNPKSKKRTIEGRINEILTLIK